MNSKVNQHFTFSVIGTGRVGGCLLRSLPIIGGICTGIVSTSAEKTRDRFPDVLVSESVSSLTYGKICFLCVPDDHIERISAEIASSGSNMADSIFVHVSGAKNSTSLLKLREQGALIASFHPLASFKPDENIDIFRNTWISIEGDEAAIQVLTELGNLLGANPQKVDTDFKIRLHLCAVIVSNFMSALVIHASDIIRGDVADPTQFIRKNFSSLMQSTLINIRTHGFPDALTGPAARNDLDTMQLHKRMLDSIKMDKRIYQELSDVITRYVELSKPKDQ